jgi:two-component system LytT family response regulator
VVFLDISMPNITGLELADSIIQLEPKTFIIFKTDSIFSFVISGYPPS